MAVLSKLSLNLTQEEMDVVRSMLRREANSVEWAMIDAEWSEHCSYKSSKPILKQLPTKAKHVLVGPGYDAGVVDVGDNYVVTLHIESHNHPSAIDPYGGAATGIGGVIRDILCMGTRPIALIDPLRFGNLDQSIHSKWLFKNVIKGIADYGNCVGVPTVSGEVEFDGSFERNCLVDVACIGVGKRENLVLAEARQEGDLLILAGGNTGRDGIHGVTFASRTLSESSDKERASVQVPDPFIKKLIIEATLEAVATGAVRGLKDLGGGGLTSALSEMAYKGGCGIDIELSKVNLREPDMLPEEIMISESQERMLFVAKKGEENKVCMALDKYSVPYSIIGKVNDNGVLTVRKDDNIIASLPIELVADAPIIRRRSSKPKYLNELSVTAPPQPRSLGKVLLKLLSSPNIASREWIYRQYDHEVGIRTVINPGQCDAAVLKLPNGKFLAMKSDGNSKHAYLDPYYGAAGCVSEACRNIVAVGAKPLAMIDHCQVGDPAKPDVFWTFSEVVRGMADYCQGLDLPVVGGKVSFYNEDTSTGKTIKPSPVIVTIGLIEESESIGTMGLKEIGSSLILIGETRSEMGGSEYYEHIHNLEGGIVPKVDVTIDKRLFFLIQQFVASNLVNSVHDCSKGGFAVALAEMCISGGLGASIDASRISTSLNRLDELLFSESHGRFILEVPRTGLGEVKKKLLDAKLEFRVVGETVHDRLTVTTKSKKVFDLPLKDLKRVWEMTLPRIMGETV